LEDTIFESEDGPVTVTGEDRIGEGRAAVQDVNSRDGGETADILTYKKNSELFETDIKMDTVDKCTIDTVISDVASDQVCTYAVSAGLYGDTFCNRCHVTIFIK
jgi:hypothetical protein